VSFHEVNVRDRSNSVPSLGVEGEVASMNLCFQRSFVPVPYAEALRTMQCHVESMRKNPFGVPERIWFTSHPPVYAYGPRTDLAQLMPLEHGNIPLYAVPRGGTLTFHGPGQRMVYLMLSLKKRHLTLRALIETCERWILETFAAFGICGRLKPPHRGIWTEAGKMASLGLFVQGGVTSYGFALNVHDDLSAFQSIHPCGLLDPMTSMESCIGPLTLDEVDCVLQKLCPFD
jgi:lipoyl(octanoyl) transferase